MQSQGKGFLAELYSHWLCGTVVWHGSVAWLCGTVLWHGCVAQLCGVFHPDSLAWFKTGDNVMGEELRIFSRLIAKRETRQGEDYSICGL